MSKLEELVEVAQAVGELAEGIIGALEAKKPTIRRAAKLVVELMTETNKVKTAEYYDSAALNYRSMFTALIRAGFTGEHAFILLLDREMKLDALKKQLQKIGKVRAGGE
jgi:hypothetical protein